MKKKTEKKKAAEAPVVAPSKAKPAKKAKGGKAAPKASPKTPSLKDVTASVMKKASSPKALKKARATLKTARAREAGAEKQPTVIKKVIQGADAQALKVLVEAVKQNHLQALDGFTRLAEKQPAAIHHRARIILDEEGGLTPLAAGVIALRLAETELKAGGVGRNPVEVNFVLDGKDATVLCFDNASAETLKGLLDSMEEDEEDTSAAA